MKGWGVRVMLLATALALVASPAPEDDPSTSWSLEKAYAGPTVELTSLSPAAVFVIRARADSLGPEEVVTTDRVMASLYGTITRTQETGTFVSVAFGNGGPLRALTEFQQSSAPVFEGSCEAPDQPPGCSAELVVAFTRADGGSEGGSVVIDWSLAFSSYVSTPTAPDAGTIELPWTIEAVPQ